MGWFGNIIRRRKAANLGRLADRLKYDDKYAEAARAYMEQADLTLPDNELIAADENKYAFELWLKAGDTDNAFQAARNALHAYSQGSWLKGDNPYIDDLTYMVGALRKADRFDQADLLLTEINDFLGTIGDDPLTVAVIGKDHRFPPECPHCGGAITYHGIMEEIACPFCQGSVHSLDG